MRVGSRIWTVAAVGLAVVGLSGCSLLGGGDDDSTGAGTTGESAVQLADDGSVKDALASLTRPYGGYDVTVDVLRIKRFEKTMRLEVAVTPRSSGATSDLSSSFFAASSNNDAGGLYLLDTVNLKKYPVLQAKDECICSSDLSAFPLDKTTVLFADFPLAPESVKQLNVIAPRLGALTAAELS